MLPVNTHFFEIEKNTVVESFIHSIDEPMVNADQLGEQPATKQK